MRIASFVGGLLVGGLLWTQGAAASTIVQGIDFLASNFTSIPAGHLAPVEPVAGSFTLQFDPTLDYTNSTDITVDVLNITLDSLIGSVKFDYEASSHLLQIHTGDTLGVSGNTNTFWLALIFSPTPPIGPEFKYAQAGNSFAFVAGDVSVALTPTPIPGSVLMLLSGLTAMGGIVLARSRRPNPAPAGVAA